MSEELILFYFGEFDLRMLKILLEDIEEEDHGVNQLYLNLAFRCLEPSP